jgi:HEAT repeat protein
MSLGRLFLLSFAACWLLPAAGRAEEASAADEALLREAKIGSDGPALLKFFRRRTPTPENRKLMEGWIRDLGSVVYRERSQAAAQLTALGPPALPFLQAALKNPDYEVVKRARDCIRAIESGPGPTLVVAAARMLEARRPDGAVGVLLDYLAVLDSEWLREEVLLSLGSLGLNGGKVDPLLEAALKDRVPLRRAAAVYVLARMGGAAERGLVRPLLVDPEPMVRRHAAQGLVGAEALRPADESSAAEEALLRQYYVGADAPALLAFLRRRSLTDADQRHFQDLVVQLGHPSYKKRRQAVTELVLAGSAARPFVDRAVKTSEDLEVIKRAAECLARIDRGPGPALPTAAIRLLVKQAPPEAIKVLLTYAPSAEDESVEQAVLAGLAVLSVREEKVDPALGAALRDPAPARRAAAAYVLGRVGLRADCRAVRRLLHDSAATVRFRAAQGLVFAKDRSALPILLDLLGQDAARPFAWKVEDVLRQVAGARAPDPPAAETTAQARRLSHEAWQKWWREFGTKVDLRGVGTREGRLGMVVICEFDSTRSGGGHAWEFHLDFKPDFKPRWLLQNLPGPMDAHVLPGRKVLVAEYYQTRVTERDLKGKILWEHKVSSYPIACQQLPGGTIFIATYNHVMEVTRDHRILYNHNRSADGQIYSAQRLRNGHVIYFTSAGWVVELESGGKVLHRFNVGNPGAWCGIEGLANGHYLVTLMATGRIQEVDTLGKVYWHTTVVGAHQTLRLPDGHTLVVCMNNKRLVRVDRAGKVVWEHAMEGRPWRVHYR